MAFTADQTKPFPRTYFKLANNGKPPYAQCNLKISEVKINLVNLQNLNVEECVCHTLWGPFSLLLIPVPYIRKLKLKAKILLYSTVGGKRKQA